MTYKKVLGSHNPLEVPLVKRVVEAGREESFEMYLVGGYIRDLLWDRDASNAKAAAGKASNAKDLDFAVAGGKAFDLAQALATRFCGHFVPLDPVFDTARVVFDDGTFVDLTGCIGGSIEADLKRRDFTINALAFDPNHPGAVLDIVGGVEDIEKRIIRAISLEVLKDDPLRLLRAFRFKAVLDATIEPQTLTWIEQLAEAIDFVAAERINAEMFTLLDAPGAGDVVRELADARLLEFIFPELCATRKVTPNQYHHLNLFDHSVETVRQLELKLPELPDWVHESNGVNLSYGVSKLAGAKLAALLHDIGKPDTWEVLADGRHTFYGHDKVGAEMAEATAYRMKWSKPVSRLIVKLIKMHLRPGALFHQGPPTPRALQRFYRKVGEDMPELMILAFGDLGATKGDGLPEQSRQTLSENLLWLLSGYKSFIEQKLDENRLLSGTDVMQMLSIHPGPVVGEILEALSEAQGLNEVIDRPQAEEFVLRYYRKKYSS